MFPFKYTRAQAQAEAASCLADNPAATLLAGGTTLIDLMKLSVMTPNQLIDINKLSLAEIEAGKNGARIGALARNSDVATHGDIQKYYPLVSQAILSGASTQLRNMATVGGNIMQRTRCPYFRDTAMPCNKRTPGSGCPAIEGFNRGLSILGGSDHCIATHASDMCVALVALDADVHIQGPNGERKVALTDFYLLPDNHPEKETVLEPEEIIVAIELPESPFAAHSHYLKVRDRQSFSFALTSAACALDLQKGKIADARIALGGVATKPWRALAAEKSLIGKEATEANFKQAAEIALQGAQPRQYNGFKVELCKRTIASSLFTALGGTT